MATRIAPKPKHLKLFEDLGQAIKKGDFAAYGAALQRLDDAINKYNATK